MHSGNHSSLLIGHSHKNSNHAVAWGSKPRTITSTRTKVLQPRQPPHLPQVYHCTTLSPAHAQTCIYTPRITSHGATFPTHSNRKDPRTFIPKGAAPYFYKPPLILSGKQGFCYCIEASTNYGSQLICVAAGLLRARKERYGILQSLYKLYQRFKCRTEKLRSIKLLQVTIHSPQFKFWYMSEYIEFYSHFL